MKQIFAWLFAAIFFAAGCAQSPDLAEPVRGGGYENADGLVIVAACPPATARTSKRVNRLGRRATASRSFTTARPMNTRPRKRDRRPLSRAKPASPTTTLRSL
ncbi:MAG: hypothetical protein ACLRSE_13680 [Alistipes finegoldii]